MVCLCYCVLPILFFWNKGKVTLSQMWNHYSLGLEMICPLELKTFQFSVLLDKRCMSTSSGCAVAVQCALFNAAQCYAMHQLLNVFRHRDLISWCMIWLRFNGAMQGCTGVAGAAVPGGWTTSDQGWSTETSRRQRRGSSARCTARGEAGKAHTNPFFLLQLTSKVFH